MFDERVRSDVPGDLHVTHADGRAYGAAPPGSPLTHVGDASLGINAPCSG